MSCEVKSEGCQCEGCIFLKKIDELFEISARIEEKVDKIAETCVRIENKLNEVISGTIQVEVERVLLGDDDENTRWDYEGASHFGLRK